MGPKEYHKKIPLWLKTGIASVLAALIILLVSFLFDNPDAFIDFFRYFDFISLILCVGICKGYDTLIHGITIWPSIFIIGSLIGFILSKIKN